MAMIFGCCMGVIYMESSVKETETKVPQIDCNFPVSPEKAYADLLNFRTVGLVPNGDYHCFCKKKYDEQVLMSDKIEDVKLGDDGSCEDWFDL